MCSSNLDFGDRGLEAAGLDPSKAMATPGLVSTIQLEHLIRDPKNPCDPDLDVIPAIQQCAAGLARRNETIKNWSYCREAAIRNRDQRLAGNPAPTDRPATDYASRNGRKLSAFERLDRKLEEASAESKLRFDDERDGGQGYTIDAEATRLAG